MSEEHVDRLLKMLIIGNSGVGKSCLLTRYTENTFTTKFYSTVGVDFKLKTTDIDGRKVRLQIWDTAGQDKFKTLTSVYYKNAHGVMLVYDITDRESFEALKFWQQEAEKYGSEDLVMMVVGNKLDMQDDRTVTFNEAKEYASSNNFGYAEVSALSDKNIERAFQSFTRLVIKMFDELPPERQKTMGRKLEPQKSAQNASSSSQSRCGC